jgi:tetratricopeptide (TPR) repeat protein
VVAAIAAVLLAVHALAFLSTAWVARRASRVTDPRVRNAFRRAVAAMGVRQPVELRVTRHVAIPAVLAFPRPVLLLPADAIAWDEPRLMPALLHELAHVRRHDGIGLAVSRLGTALLWFHPLAWTLSRQAERDCERACDDLVLGAGVRASDYADLLLSIARAVTRRDPWPGMSLPLARPSSLEGRLLSILRTDLRRAPLTRRMAAVTTLAVIGLLLPVAVVRVVAGTAGTTTRTHTETSTATVTRFEEQTATSGDAAGDGVVDTRTAEEWFAQAKSEYRAARFDTAGQDYERAAQGGYRTDIAWYNAACSYALAGQHNRAVGALHEALDHGFDDASLLARDDDLAAIRSDRRVQMMLRAAQDPNAGGVPATNVDKKTKGAWSSSETEPLLRYKAEAMYELRSGDPRRAASLFLQEYAIDSTASALYNAACAWAIAAERGPALDALERSILAGYGDREKLTSDNDLDGVRREPRFDQLVDLADELDMKLPKHGFDADNVEEWRQILPHYERAAREHPGAGRAWFNLGLVQLRTNDPQAARESYQRALAAGYRRGATLYNLACSEARAGNLDAAFRQLQQAEDAGMQVWQIAPGDRDLDPLRGDPRYRAMESRWDQRNGDSKNAGKKDG